jgi:hypothetical protein
MLPTGCPAQQGGKLQGRQCANAWWLAKKTEIDGTQAASHLITELEKRRDWYRLRGEAGQAADYEAAISEVRGWRAEDVQVDGAQQQITMPPSEVWQRIAVPSPEVWQDRIERDRPESIPEDRTVRGQAERWLAGQEVKVKAGALAPGTLRNNADCLAHFRKFMGDVSPVTAIDEERLEVYFYHLIGRLPDFSRDYALKCFGTAKAFIRYLVEKDLIPFPKNVESRSFRFSVGAGQILDLPDYLLDGLGIGHAGWGGDGPAARLDDVTDGLGDLVLQAGGEAHGGTCRCQADGYGPADAPAASGDDRHLACQIGFIGRVAFHLNLRSPGRARLRAGLPRRQHQG